MVNIEFCGDLQEWKFGSWNYIWPVCFRMSPSFPLCSFNDYKISIFWTYVILLIVLELNLGIFLSIGIRRNPIITSIYICLLFHAAIYYLLHMSMRSIWDFSFYLPRRNKASRCLSFIDFTMFNSVRFVQIYTTHIYIYICPIYPGDVNAQIAKWINRIQLSQRNFYELKSKQTLRTLRFRFPSDSATKYSLLFQTQMQMTDSIRKSIATNAEWDDYK